MVSFLLPPLLLPLRVNKHVQRIPCRHSLNAISSQLSPAHGCSGIEILEADTFDLHSFQTLTGTKFLLISTPGASFIPSLLQRIYELYSDYVLKNPYYEMEQPIKCEKFDLEVQSAIHAQQG